MTRTAVRSHRLDGSDVHVIDGLFPADLIRLVYEGLRDLPFVRTEYDTEQSRDVLHLNFEFDLEALLANPVFCLLRDGIAARTRELFPVRLLTLKRVHCNNHPYGDMQFSHTDLVPGVTSLYFANAEWPDEWQGETIFYDRSGEPRYAVAPRPGRVVIFPGDLLHRGGVPSRACKVARLSLAFKFAAA